LNDSDFSDPDEIIVVNSRGKNFEDLSNEEFMALEESEFKVT